MVAEMDIRVLQDGDEVARCTGPSADGSCPRVAIGDLVPCASHEVVPGRATQSRPCAVSGQSTICPVTLAAMITVKSDAAFFED